jgi:hypothetical protein
MAETAVAVPMKTLRELVFMLRSISIPEREPRSATGYRGAAELSRAGFRPDFAFGDMKPTLALLGLLTLSLSSASASPIEVWNFTGVCTDCPGTGTGTLTVEQSSFTFSYTSAWISYTLANAIVQVDEETQTPGVPLPNLSAFDLYIRGTGSVTSFGGTNGQFSNPLPVGTQTRQMYFFSYAGANWGTGEFALADFGPSQTWTAGSQSSAVPEPSTFALLASAAVVGGVLRRRRSR